MGPQCHEKLIVHAQISTRHAFTIFERDEARARAGIDRRPALLDSFRE